MRLAIILIIFSGFSLAQEAPIVPSDPPAIEESDTKPAPVAPDIDLKEVTAPLEPVKLSPTETADPVTIDEIPIEDVEVISVVEPLNLLGATVLPGTSTRLAWSPEVSFNGLSLPTPVLVVHGNKPGPTLCLTAAIHGDEINGIEVVRRVMYDISPDKLSGTVIGVPIVNLQGFQRGSRYLNDRRDLNRYFPGDAKGSLASRIAYSLFNEVIIHCNLLVDIHTGSLRRNNLAQIRADMSNQDVADFTEGFDDMVVVHSRGAPGMLRNAANKINIRAVTLELGESLRLQRHQVDSGVKGIYSLLKKQKMYSKVFDWGEPAPIYYSSSWMRVTTGGLLLSNVKLGDVVRKGAVLGTVTDPITNESSDVIAELSGRIIGMATDQVVMPGFAAYHIGVKSSEKGLMGEAQNEDVDEF